MLWPSQQLRVRFVTLCWYRPKGVTGSQAEIGERRRQRLDGLPSCTPGHWPMLRTLRLLAREQICGQCPAPSGGSSRTAVSSDYSICKIPHQLLKLRIQSEDCYQQIPFPSSGGQLTAFLPVDKGLRGDLRSHSDNGRLGGIDHARRCSHGRRLRCRSCSCDRLLWLMGQRLIKSCLHSQSAWKRAVVS